jgi:WhiB family redox-sensing transcriptional regulator
VEPAVNSLLVVAGFAAGFVRVIPNLKGLPPMTRFARSSDDWDTTIWPADADADAVEPIGRRAPLGLPCQVHDAELWFAEKPADLERAKALCGDCPVRSACLLGAIRRQEPAGVWGGEIFQAGVVIPFKRGRGRPPKNTNGLGAPPAATELASASVS